MSKKYCKVISIFLLFRDLLAQKLLSNVDEIDTCGQFYQHSTSSFHAPRAQKRKIKWSVFLHFWDLCAQKLLVERWWNWHLSAVLPPWLFVVDGDQIRQHIAGVQYQQTLPNDPEKAG
jgi:hypothetical protein